MEGSVDFRILEDKWTAVSADDRRWEATSQYRAMSSSVLTNTESNHDNVVLPCRSAQFEHTVVITSDGVDILTKLPAEECVS